MVPTVPRVLAVLPGFFPSTLLDVVKPMLALDQQGKIRFNVVMEEFSFPSDFRRCDLAIFCRNVEPRFISKMCGLVERGVPFIYDIDDNFFDIAPDTVLGAYHRNPARLAAVASYMKNAGLVRVYSTPVLEHAVRFNPLVELVNPPLDWNLIAPSAKRAEGSPVRIIYATSRVDDTISELFLPALRRVLQERPGKVEVFFWGWKPEALARLPGVQYFPPELNYDAFMRRFSQMGFDIGLAPLPDDRFHRSKTNNKFREYGACHIAGIYSNISVYSDCVEDGRTGLLVENQPDAWYDALLRLVDDSDLRTSIQVEAEREVRARYSQAHFEEVWYTQIFSVLAGSRGPIPGSVVELVSPSEFAPPNSAAAASLIVESGLRRVLTKLWKLIRSGNLRPLVELIRRYLGGVEMLLRVNLFKKL